MTTLTRPTTFVPRECSLALRKSSLQFTSPFNGTLQALETLAERWVMNLALPAAAASGAGGSRSAFLNQWAGGVNLVPLYHFGRPLPLGTLRGTPTLGATTARGDSSLVLAGCTGTNAVRGGSFETDANSDGLADGWLRFSGGTTGTLGASLSGTAVAAGNYSQSLIASGLGATSADRNGVYQSGIPAAHLAGQAFTLAASMAGTLATELLLYLTWQNGAGSTISGADAFATTTANGGVQALSVSGTAPSTAATATVYAYQHSGSGGAVTLLVDAVQLVQAASAGTYPAAATLLQGDMVGNGTQLYQVAEDCTATDAGAMTVPVVNRARGAVASGTAVLWSRPTALFALPSLEQASTWMRGGLVDGLLLDAVEVY